MEPSESTKPVIFLDFDGVLNTPETEWKRPRETEAIDADKVVRFSRLAEQLDAEVVISSSWRERYDLPALKAMLTAKGLVAPERIIGLTEVIGIDRGDEVELWLLRNRPHGVPFVVLDDVGGWEFSGFDRQLIRTDPRVGLTDLDCRKAVASIERQRERPRQTFLSV